MYIDNLPKETTAYRCYDRYEKGFKQQSNILAYLKEVRDFYQGKQYLFKSDNLPQPCLNIVREYAEKVTAKLTETERAVKFIADSDKTSLNKLDDFYSYQMKQINDDDITSKICLRGFVDGVAVCFTMFDEDTLGVQSKYRGFLKRQIIPFEDTFYENPYTEDVQDQMYLGYTMKMEVKAVKDMVEGKNDKEIKEKQNFIIPDEYINANGDISDFNPDLIDSKTVTVICRLFRVEGEVYFELATRYVDLYTSPHPLNPDISEEKIKEEKKDLEERITKGGSLDSQDKSEEDYNLDSASYALFTKAKKEDESHYKKEHSKFYRYPVSIFRPYPIDNCILGESGAALLIPNQKIINFNTLLMTLIIQNHAMPKWVVKEGALNGQIIDTSPSQVLVDYTKYSNGTWGITKINAGDSISDNLVQITSVLMQQTKQINGFDDLAASQIGSDVSGYALQQYYKQSNLTLEIPQKRLWNYIKDNALTDLLYFKHYVDEAKYYEVKSDSDIELQNDYMQMAQSNVDNGIDPNFKPGQVLPDNIRNNVSREIRSEDFDHDFNILVDIQQGISQSEITESQHYQEVLKVIATGNMDPALIKVWIMNDPSFSKKTRQNLKTALDSYFLSDLKRKDAEIEQLKSMIGQLQTQLQQAVSGLQGAARQVQSVRRDNDNLKRAFVESNQQNQAAMQAFMNQGSTAGLSEGEVKSNNAKGEEGTSFQGQSAY